MTTQPQNEPSMEEILASIRRIIYDEPQAPGASSDEPEAVPAADDILELTPDMRAAPPPLPEPEPEPVPAAIPEPVFAPSPAYMPEPALPLMEASEPLMSAQTEAAAAAALAGLSSANLSSHSQFEGQTVETLVRELLRPMLRQWMDTNLPTLVEGWLKPRSSGWPAADDKVPLFTLFRKR